MLRLLFSLLSVAAAIAAAWFIFSMAGVELELVPSLIVALLLTTVLHLGLNRARWRS